MIVCKDDLRRINICVDIIHPKPTETSPIRVFRIKNVRVLAAAKRTFPRVIGVIPDTVLRRIRRAVRTVMSRGDNRVIDMTQGKTATRTKMSGGSSRKSVRRALGAALTDMNVVVVWNWVKLMRKDSFAIKTHMEVNEICCPRGMH